MNQKKKHIDHYFDAANKTPVKKKIGEVEQIVKTGKFLKSSSSINYLKLFIMIIAAGALTALIFLLTPFSVTELPEQNEVKTIVVESPSELVYVSDTERVVGPNLSYEIVVEKVDSQPGVKEVFTKEPMLSNRDSYENELVPTILEETEQILQFKGFPGLVKMEFMVDENTTNAQLDAMRDKALSDGVVLKIRKRRVKGQLRQVSVRLKCKKEGSTACSLFSFSWKSSKANVPLYFGWKFNKNGSIRNFYIIKEDTEIECPGNINEIKTASVDDEAVIPDVVMMFDKKSTEQDFREIARISKENNIAFTYEIKRRNRKGEITKIGIRFKGKDEFGDFTRASNIKGNIFEHKIGFQKGPDFVMNFYLQTGSSTKRYNQQHCGRSAK